ncbi:MBL fold metallo-hydrolase [Tsukamurella soli]|uniref:MBL fold metallo-hydrolase n=1 Tax=Tsukamurella soli TaxID=644556 RepID=UPI0036177AAE
MSDLRVHHLNCAHVTAMSIGGLPLACHVLLIETPSDGLVLVDSGLGTADYAAIASRLGFAFARLYARPTVAPALAAIHQVRALGHRPEDVRHIVQTHLDLDHVGGLSDFPWAAVHVHADELAAATDRRGVKARGRYRPAMWAHGPDFTTYAEEDGEAWFGFSAVRALAGLPEQILLIHCVAIPTVTAASPSTASPDGSSTPVTPSSTTVNYRCDLR